MRNLKNLFVRLFCLAALLANAWSFSSVMQSNGRGFLSISNNGSPRARLFARTPITSSSKLHAEEGESEASVASSDQFILGAAGTFAALVTFYSEYTLKMTGCGLPAGPFGLVGALEGLSYLGVTGIVAYSVVTKIKTGSGLPAGPSGLLGAAEGLSFLAILVGLVVLVLQVTSYGYIPNAIPMEGGMCS